jgi:hypothetical protein
MIKIMIIILIIIIIWKKIIIFKNETINYLHYSSSYFWNNDKTNDKTENNEYNDKNNDNNRKQSVPIFRWDYITSKLLLDYWRYRPKRSQQ